MLLTVFTNSNVKCCVFMYINATGWEPTASDPYCQNNTPSWRYLVLHQVLYAYYCSFRGYIYHFRSIPWVCHVSNYVYDVWYKSFSRWKFRFVVWDVSKNQFLFSLERAGRHLYPPPELYPSNTHQFYTGNSCSRLYFRNTLSAMSLRIASAVSSITGFSSW